MPGILRNWVGYIVYISLWGRTSSINWEHHVDHRVDLFGNSVEEKLDVHSDAS